MKPVIVFVDDESLVLDSLRRTLHARRPDWTVLTFASPVKALDLLLTVGADTIVTDLGMPVMDGLTLLGRLKESDVTKDIPVIILTGQNDRGLRCKALEMGAADLLTKPTEADELVARVASALRFKQCHDQLKEHNAALEVRVQQRSRELSQVRLEVIWRLAKAAEFHDEETGNHVIRVASYSRAIGEQLGLDQEFLEKLFVTAPLHDIGKIGISDSILLKPGPLTPDEKEVMKQHCVIGARILRDECKATQALRGSQRKRPETAPDPLLEMASAIALTHHEKWNGTGYPQGLAGDAIPIAARIVAIADVYDALTSNRPYKTAYSQEKSLEILAEGKGSHFDPEVFEAFHSTLPKILEIKQNLSERSPNSDRAATGEEGNCAEVNRPESAIRALAEAVLST
jgi:response regulator RpfG family c-di-GMP phosphodiesterase